MELNLGRPIRSYDVGHVSQMFGGNAEVYQKFGIAGHNGLDYSVPVGTEICAAHPGYVELRPFDANGFGYYLKVMGNGVETLYAHLSKFVATDRMQVSAGDVIAKSGNTGNSTGPHLHFGVRIQAMRNDAYGHWIDPYPFRVVTWEIGVERERFFRTMADMTLPFFVTEDFNWTPKILENAKLWG